MGKIVEAKINPSMLVWAREEQGYDIRFVKRKFLRLEQWERGEKKPSMVQLRKLAHYYRRPSAIFYLQKPPETKERFVDFRIKPDSSYHELGPEAKTEIRVCESRRNKALELSESMDIPSAFGLPVISLESDIEEAVLGIRRMLGIDQNEIEAIRDAKGASAYWINKIESANVLVFKSITLKGWNASYKEIRGTGAYYPNFPWILVNSQEHEHGQLFTLGHELSHILLKGASICDLGEEISNTSLSKIERFCNQFSATLHIPKNLFYEFARKNSLNFDNKKNIQAAISMIQRAFHVSPEAAARRLHTLGLVTADYYRAMRKRQMAELDKERQRAEAGGNGKYYYRRVLNWNGVKYVQLVLEGYHQNLISLGEAAQALGTKVNHMESIEREMYT